MSRLDLAKNLLEARIVYWGPAGSGKTESLAGLRRFLDPGGKMRLFSMADADGGTVFFDMLPLEDFNFGPFRVRTRLLAVPGTAGREETRRALVADADAIVMVADSRTDALDRNRASMRELNSVLHELGRDPATVPVVWTFNHSDDENAMASPELCRALLERKVPSFETVATEGRGLFESFSEIFREMMTHIADEHGVAGTDLDAAYPSSLLPALRKGVDPTTAAPGRQLVVSVGETELAAQAVEAQIRLSEEYATADTQNRMLEERNRELMAINRVARSILSAMEADNLLVVLLDATADYLGITHMSCVVFDASQSGALRSHVQGFGRDPVLGLPAEDARAFFELVEHSDGPIPADPQRNPELHEALRKVDSRVVRAMYQPIKRTDGKPAGWLGIYTTGDERPLTTQKLLFLSSISRLTALGLEKISLLEEVRSAREGSEQQVEERTAQLEMANARIRALNRGLESRVTERTRALEEANRALKEARANSIHTARLRGMGHLATQLAQEVGDPVDGIAHNIELMRASLDDLRAIVATSATGSDDGLSALDDFETILEQSTTSTDRITSVISSLDRLGGDGTDVEETSVSLNALLADTVTLIEERMRNCAELDLRLGTLPEIRANARELSHAILALLTNAVEAIEATEHRGQVVITTFASGGQITLMLQDTGCGIDEELLPRIFEPFVSSKRDGGSAGLGLHIAYRAVQHLGGTIKVRTKPGEGTTVKMLLPCEETADVPANAADDVDAAAAR